jgi:hypothetical protein
MISRDRVPSGLWTLIPLLDEWAIADDLNRSMKIEEASTEQLRELVRQVDSVDQAALYNWLAGPEAKSAAPTAEYLAFTCLTMAADEARVTLKQGG